LKFLLKPNSKVIWVLVSSFSKLHLNTQKLLLHIVLLLGQSIIKCYFSKVKKKRYISSLNQDNEDPVVYFSDTWFLWFSCQTAVRAQTLNKATLQTIQDQTRGETGWYGKFSRCSFREGRLRTIAYFFSIYLPSVIVQRLKPHRLWSQCNWGLIPTSHVMLGRHSDFFVPPFLPMWNGHTWWVEEMN